MRRIDLGPACNNACVFCAQGDLRLRSASDDARVRPQLEAISPGEAVAFQGGEPTLHDALPSWLREAEERGAARVILQTNGRRLAYASYARALGEACSILSLEVSFHGSTAPMHDYHTGVEGSFKQTALGLRNARGLGLPAYVTTVLTRLNFRHTVEILRVLAALGVRGQQLVVAQPEGCARGALDRVVPAVELVEAHVRRAVTEARRLGVALRVGEQQSDASLLDRFAGLGEVAPFAAEPIAQRAEPRGKVKLKLVGKAAPGLGERRVPTRQTGEGLREIFPDLFASNLSTDAREAKFRPLSADDIQRLAAEEAARRAAGGGR